MLAAIIITQNILIFLAIFIIGFVGLLPITNSKRRSYSVLFYSLSSGLIIFTTLYSITITKGVTVNVIILLLFGFYFIRSFSLSRLKENLSSLTEFVGNYTFIIINGLLALILSTLIELFRNDFFNPNERFLAYTDFFFYARVAEYLNQYGIENHLSHLFQIGYSIQPRMYHYFDIWNLALLQRFSLQNMMDTYLFTFVPLCVSIIFVGFIAIFNNICKYKWWNWIFIFSAVYGLCLLPFLDLGFTRNIVISPKVFPAYFTITLSVLLLLKRHYNLFILVLCSLAVMSIPHAPAALSILILMSVVFYYIGERKLVIPSIVWPVITAVLIFAFYIIFSRSDISGEIIPIQVDQSKSILRVLKSMVRAAIFSSKLSELPAGLFAIFLVVILNFKYMKKMLMNHKDLMLTMSYLLMFVITSFGCVALVPLSTDQFVQISRNTINPLYSLITIIVLAILFKKIRSQSKVNFLSIISIVIISAQISYGMYFSMAYYTQRNEKDLAYVSKDFIDNLSISLQNQNLCGGYIYSETTLLEDQYLNHPNLFQLGVFINYVDNARWLTPLHILPEDHKFFEINQTSPLNLFIAGKKESGEFVSNQQSQLDFINKYQIGYIVIDRGVVVPDLLKERIEKIIVDPTSLMRVIILKLDKSD